MNATPPSPPPAAPEALRPVAHLELKAAALLLFTLALIVGSVMYLLYARGAFEPTQTLVLVADDSEGVVVGMDMTFSGFPIGRVRRIELADEGNARIVVDVARKDAHWLRVSSVFTLVRGMVGGTAIRAYSGLLNDDPLPDGAVRPVLRGDATSEIPQLMASARELLGNLNALTAQDAALASSLAQVRTLTERLNAPGGALQVLMGNAQDAGKVLAALDRTNALLTRIDGLAAKTDTQLYGPGGLMPQVQASVAQLGGLLADTRATLKKVDAVLAEAQAVGANVREGTADLGALRAEVESNLRKIDQLVGDIQRKWPFARDTELTPPCLRTPSPGQGASPPLPPCVCCWQHAPASPQHPRGKWIRMAHRSVRWRPTSAGTNGWRHWNGSTPAKPLPALANPHAWHGWSCCNVPHKLPAPCPGTALASRPCAPMLPGQSGPTPPIWLARRWTPCRPRCCHPHSRPWPLPPRTLRPLPTSCSFLTRWRAWWRPGCCCAGPRHRQRWCRQPWTPRRSWAGAGPCWPGWGCSGSGQSRAVNPMSPPAFGAAWIWWSRALRPEDGPPHHAHTCHGQP